MSGTPGERDGLAKRWAEWLASSAYWSRREVARWWLLAIADEIENAEDSGSFVNWEVADWLRTEREERSHEVGERWAVTDEDVDYVLCGHDEPSREWVRAALHVFADRLRLRARPTEPERPETYTLEEVADMLVTRAKEFGEERQRIDADSEDGAWRIEYRHHMEVSFCTAADWLRARPTEERDGDDR